MVWCHKVIKMDVFVYLVLILTLAQSLTGSLDSRLNFFDTDLLRYSAEDRRGNVMVSPASIKSALAMVLEGARGETAEEIRRALRLSPKKEEYREELSSYLAFLKANITGAVIKNSNAIFESNLITLNKDFETTVKHAYFGEVRKLDFKDPVKAADAINKWISDNTAGLIPDIVENIDINPQTDLLLTNAVYFRSSWQHAFNPKLTRAGCFTGHDGVCQTVAMMDLHAELKYAYVDNLRAHAVELPYVSGRYSMVLLVPQDRDGCLSIIRDIPYMSLSHIIELLEPSDVQLTMPKFTLDYSEDMIRPLRSMRITSLFSSHANLTGFSPTNTQINSIFHRVHLTVDEAGTVAAAATAAMVIPLIESGVRLLVDRPFVFFIKDNQLGFVLFEGKIERPNAFVEENSNKDKQLKPLIRALPTD